MDNCFDLDNPLRKLFNRNTVKISYRCMPNIRSAIAKHISAILGSEKSIEDKNVNVRGDKPPAL